MTSQQGVTPGPAARCELVVGFPGGSALPEQEHPLGRPLQPQGSRAIYKVFPSIVKMWAAFQPSYLCPIPASGPGQALLSISSTW